MELKQHDSPWYIGKRLLDILESDDLEEYLEDYQQEVRTFLYWLNADRLSRRPINRALKQYAFDGQIPWEYEHEEVILR